MLDKAFCLLSVSQNGVIKSFGRYDAMNKLMNLKLRYLKEHSPASIYMTATKLQPTTT